MGRAYEIRTQWVHNGCIAFLYGHKDSFYALCPLCICQCSGTGPLLDTFIASLIIYRDVGKGVTRHAYVTFISICSSVAAVRATSIHVIAWFTVSAIWAHFHTLLAIGIVCTFCKSSSMYSQNWFNVTFSTIQAFTLFPYKTFTQNTALNFVTLWPR